MKMPGPDLTEHLAELQQRLSALTQAMSQADKSQFVQSLLAGLAERFELVRREDFEAQHRQLQRALEQLAQLEARLARLESSQTHD
ncbi:MAG: Membrane fusogenic [Pseudomonadota bacterium]|jgi:BMFP domain-containing protein YqiC